MYISYLALTTKHVIKRANMTLLLCIHLHIKFVYKEPPAVTPMVVFVFSQCDEEPLIIAIFTQIKPQTIAVQSLVIV
jgi:hypothetical protein